MTRNRPETPARSPLRLAGVVLGAATLVGCAHAVPKELADARTAFRNAENSQAEQLVPTRVYEARQALDEAEQAHAERWRRTEQRDLAYIAHRKADLALVYGEIEASERARSKTVRDERKLLERQRNTAAAELDETRDQLALARGSLQAERQARKAAQLELQKAMTQLASFAQVDQRQEGMVITLEGAVLFESGKAHLLPMARTKLAQVAEVLERYPDRTIVVEGFTDSRGSATYNLNLSEQRAVAVRDYLVAHGVSSQSIEARGMGEADPVASNATAEGRADNRRVEIVIQNPTGSQKHASVNTTGP